jgi:murein DD-endopeptidase MepM/ murein hydrolase activator NlpD
MSHSSYSHYEYSGRAAVPRPQSTETVSRHLSQVHAPQHKRGARGYTLTHAGHQIRIGPVAFWIVVGTLVIMGVWSIATGTYFAFRDDVLTRLIGRQAAMQFAYEDRIAELRAQVDRITSRQLLDQEQFEQKLQGLLRRQSALEQRSSIMSNDNLAAGSIKPSRLAPRHESRRAIKPSPISDTVLFTAPPDREARLQSRELASSANRYASNVTAGGLNGLLTRVSLSLDKVELHQTAALTNLEEQADTKVRRIGGVFADLGIHVGKIAGRGTGGPYVPLRAPRGNASAFERQVYRINVARAEIARYTQALVTVPVRKPINGPVDMTSPFGVRLDPFLGKPAIHTGIDLRGEIGDPVHVTASGRVTRAGWAGGYGNLIEVDHGNGLSTRYGHLSKIEVKVGQHVTIGEIIGRVGSTGRSTGSHLHYETRVNGEPVDPQKFLRAGLRLGRDVLGASS